MNRIKTLLFAALLALASLTLQTPAEAQVYTATNTTTAAAVGLNDQTISVTSATGMTAAGPLAQTQTFLYIDEELMAVTTVNGTQIGVLRGQQGTTQKAHASGVTLWYGNNQQFGQKDPSGSCPLSSLYVNPLVVGPTGRVFTCVGGVWATEGEIVISPSECGVLAATTSVTDNGMVPVATNNVVHQFTTNTTAGTLQVTCDLSHIASRITAGAGIFLSDVELLYGVQTTAISSIAAATVKSITYPAAGGAASGTAAAVGGTYTVTPGTLQKATTTTGQCYAEKVAFGTPVALNTDNQKMTFDQVFTTAGTTATVLQVCGVVAHYYSVTPAGWTPNK